MSKVWRRNAFHALRTDGTPPETIVNSAVACASRGAPATWATNASASDAPLAASIQ